MDPNNGQSQGGSDSIKKLEEDLQKLSQEASATQNANQPPVEQPAQPVSEGTSNPPQASQASEVPVDQPVEPVSKDTSPPLPPDTSEKDKPLSGKKESPILIVSLVLVVIALLVAIAYAVGMKYFLGKSTQKACTLEAKVCDDGSSVGRNGPNCEFDPCPSPTATPNSTLGWQTFTGSNFVYPNKFYSGYTFLFPLNCDQVLSSLACSFTRGTGTIIVNAGGHGGENIETRVIRNGETKVIAAGEGKITVIEDVQAKTIFGTFWINKTDKLTQDPIFGFEFMNIPVDNLTEFETMFDQILSTFKFIEATPSSTPTVTPSATPIGY